MSEILKQIARGVNIVPLVSAIQRNPELWNQYNLRTENVNSPHNGLDDIWVRYNSQDNYENNASFNDEHNSVWYDSELVKPVKDIVFPLMSFVKGERLGGVLITRIPPGKECRPHIDGGWHASFYSKYAVQLQGNLQQAFCFDGESFSALPGDVYRFDNSKLHWVTNDSDQDRITMIVCIKHD